jgi:hypothetical protein
VPWFAKTARQCVYLHRAGKRAGFEILKCPCSTGTKLEFGNHKSKSLSKRVVETNEWCIKLINEFM